MKLSGLEFTQNNHFVAMEYYRLILNRSFLILITRDFLLGLKIHGMIGVKTERYDLGLSVDGDLNSPYSYIAKDYMDKMRDMDIFSDDIVRADGANFKIDKRSIISCEYDSRKKWGMGYYPHDGKVYITTDKGKRELIILGSQSGDFVRKNIVG